MNLSGVPRAEEIRLPASNLQRGRKGRGGQEKDTIECGKGEDGKKGEEGKGKGRHAKGGLGRTAG